MDFSTKKPQDQEIRDRNMEKFNLLVGKYDDEEKYNFLHFHWIHIVLPSKVSAHRSSDDYQKYSPVSGSTHGGRGRRRSFDFSTVDHLSATNSRPTSTTDHALGAGKILVTDPALQYYNPLVLDDSDCETICLEVNNASITVKEFLTITEHGLPGWFDDTTIDLSYDFIRRAFRSERYGVALCSTSEARSLYTHYSNSTSSDPEKRKLSTGKGMFDKVLINKCKRAQFIILPISDGYIYDDIAFDESGMHWTMLLVDCRSKVSLTGHFMDSLPADGCDKKTAYHVLKALDMMLDTIGQVRSHTPSLVVEQNTPNQIEDNACEEDGLGACGPFVFAMTWEMTNFIVGWHLEKHDIDALPLLIPQDFKYTWGWDSNQTRKTLANMIRRERTVRSYLCGTHEWFDKDGKRGWQNTLKETKIRLSSGKIAALPLNWFWWPRSMSSTEFQKAVTGVFEQNDSN